MEKIYEAQTPDFIIHWFEVLEMFDNRSIGITNTATIPQLLFFACDCSISTTLTVGELSKINIMSYIIRFDFIIGGIVPTNDHQYFWEEHYHRWMEHNFLQVLEVILSKNDLKRVLYKMINYYPSLEQKPVCPP